MLWIGVSITTIVAFVAILATGHYPRPLWDFAVNTLRWTANLTAYLSLQRDDYPPFSATALYPFTFDLNYPTRFSRLLVPLKWILLVLHYVVLYFL